MSPLSFNIWAILVCVIVSIVLGTFWYGPLFGAQWMKLLGIAKPDVITPEMKRKMNIGYSVTAVSSIVMNIVLVLLINHAMVFSGDRGAGLGIVIALLVWIGFVVPTSIGSVLWEGRPWKHWFINIGYYLVLLVINGIILSVWL